MEEWKDVVGYEGIYEVSNHGQVRTHKYKPHTLTGMAFVIGNSVS